MLHRLIKALEPFIDLRTVSCLILLQDSNHIIKMADTAMLFCRFEDTMTLGALLLTHRTFHLLMIHQILSKNLLHVASVTDNFLHGANIQMRLKFRSSECWNLAHVWAGDGALFTFLEDMLLIVC